ncbi:OmpA family protein [Marinimicrobium sp. ARAG 43.8]|uniref:OmpA family protein n=1 Tax=Marinimicrobium sp. ARAG 43.8 TaxID=3418719 RepID=UPI003CEBD8FB
MARISGISLASLALAITPLATVPIAQAQEYSQPKFELFGGIGRTLFDEQIEDSTHYNLGLGMNLNERWALELMATRFDTEWNGGAPDVDGEQYRLDALYHLGDAGDRARPYLAFGIGDQELESVAYAPRSSINDTLINAGLGVKYRLAERWQWRTDMRVFNNLDAEDTDFAITTGISFLFGFSDNKPAERPAPQAPADSDGDNVPDNRDRCPNTPRGISVDSNGCALDSDNDGVPDHRDQCPNTAQEYRVDDTGCPVELTENVSIEMRVQFATNSAEVREEFIPEVRQVADFMKQFDQTRVTVEGHTDSTGAAAYNQDLSQRRANAVREILVTRFGLPESRVRAVGHGEERPVADNSTEDGRERNRRVVAEISADVTRKETRDE